MVKLTKSVLSTEKKCLVCGYTLGLHRHHIYFGNGNRELSEKQGCWCWLCSRHHNMSDMGVHFNKELDLSLKRECQKAWCEAKGANTADFIKVFGKNYDE